MVRAHNVQRAANPASGSTETEWRKADAQALNLALVAAWLQADQEAKDIALAVLRGEIDIAASASVPR
ncbi:hypothetical protein J2S34_000574 [Nitrobacter winogradskyi]|uniref:Uncharacterized protein n=2 Tax=Nitrobacter winogradskyi TaxID=913 RepID=A0ACC6AE96_NITWI|nr:hypothetical protein [Nitrobacter winogradskyi]GEC15254.1 hypothetical protein NWI01_11460 [Nitrobacter winogradskyi]